MFDVVEGNKKLQNKDNPYWLGDTTQINHGEDLVTSDSDLLPQTPVEFPDVTVFSMADRYFTDEASKCPEYLFSVELALLAISGKTSVNVVL